LHPVLLTFRLGGAEVTLGAYATFYTLAWVVALALGTVVAWRRGMPWWRALLFYLVTLVVGIAGARLLDVATNWGVYAEDPGLAYGFEFHGFSLYGGLLLAAGAGVLLARPLRVPLWRAADSAVPAMAAAIVLMRTGCYLRGCCFGEVTSLPWGITFPNGSPAWSYQLATGETGLLGFTGAVHPVHPTQIYEIIAAAVFGALAVWLMMRGRRGRAAQGAGGAEGGTPPAAARVRGSVAEGAPFLVFMLGFTLFRVAEYYLRPSPLTTSEPGWFYPALYAVIIVGVAAVLAARAGLLRRR
jgi:phosphatidylglycerol---prolipoprotein diacylglyceryl transferase